MKSYMAKDGDRLDIIIFKYYKTVESDVMDAVLDENSHLLGSSVLKAGDIVYLPEITKTTHQTSTKALW